MCIAKGSDVRPGVPPVPLRCPLVSAAFAWQAWDNVHCQGVGYTPWRPSGVPPVSLGLRRFCVAGVGQCALPRGRMYALASLRCPSGVPWSPPLLRGRRGTMCTAKGSDVRPGVPPVSLQCPLVSAAFAWQAWDNVHCQGVGCTPWRPSGVPPVSLGLRRFCVAGVGQCALPRGRMYALASLRCPSGVPWSPPLLRGRRGTTCTDSLTHSLTHSLPHSLTHSTHSLPHSLTPSFTHSLTHSLTPLHSLTHSLTHSLHSLTHSNHSLTPSLPPSLTHSLTHSLIHSLPHSLTRSLTPLTHSLTHSLHSLTHSTHSPTHSLTPLTHSLTHSTHSLTHSLPPSTPLHSTPLHSTPLHSTPLHSTPLHSTPLHSTPLHSTPLHSLTPLTHSLTHSLIHSLTHSPTHSVTHSLISLPFTSLRFASLHFTSPTSLILTSLTHTPHSYHSLTLSLTHCT